MKLRPVLFWAHLSAGVLAGIVILMMSVTGVLLTYERQIVDWADSRLPISDAQRRGPLTADALFAIAEQAAPDAQRYTVTYRNAPGSVVKIAAGRDRSLWVDPHSGAVLREGKSAVEGFFDTVMAIHRWFALSGDSRATGRAVTGYSNLLFLFLLISGVYLWLPKVWNRAMLKSKILFNPKAKTARARDFNWHHVFAFWSVIPLFVVITTASVFYFPWANEMVYAAYGEKPPARRQSSEAGVVAATGSHESKEELLVAAKTELERRGVADWRTIAMRASASSGAAADFRVDRSIGGQPSKVYNLILDGTDGGVISWGTFADNSPGRQARLNVRFLHTGEVYGFFGQTIAGLASFAACLLVWTGLALAWRRLIQPLIAKRLPAVASGDA